jgi:hypothetical protein
MNCLECQEILQQRLDGRPVPDRAALDRHLASCPECRERHAAVAPLREGLRALPRAEPPADLAERTTTLLLRDRLTRLRRRRVWAGVALAASVLVAVAGYLWLNPSRTDQPTAKAPQPKSPQSAPEKTGPSLRESVGEAREGLAALVGRFAARASEGARVLESSASSLEFVSLDAVPHMGPLTGPLGSTAEGLRQGGHGASAGVKTVGGSARRAFNYFLRKMPPLQPALKRPS